MCCCAPARATISPPTRPTPFAGASSGASTYTSSKARSNTCGCSRTIPQELDLLFRDLLIGVTNFFRDPESFQALAKVALPGLLAARPDDAPVRVWAAGCSTGEEAYSLAMLLREHMDRAKRRFTVQMFATDLDPKAIEAARAGLYPEGIARDVRPQRLERFFVKEDGRYRIKKEIRELVIFATQNVLKDPPFTKLDLVACRNLLIYLQPEAQERVLSLFHYALKPGGVLFLGPSESVSAAARPLYRAG